MRYSADLRQRVINFCEAGGTQAEAVEQFGVCRKSIYNWQNSDEPLVSKTPGPKTPHKLDWKKLRTYIEKNKDALLKETATEFKVGITAVRYALKEMKISRKKNHTLR